MKTAASLAVQFDSIFSPFPSNEWREGLHWAKNSGFDAAELILCDPETMNVSALVEELGRLNLPVSTLSTGQAYGMEGLSMTSLCEDVRTETLRRLRCDIDLAVALNDAHVTIGLIRGKGQADQAEAERYHLIEGLKRTADYAAQKGIVLNLEPINRYECFHLNDSLSAMTLLEEMGCPENVGVLYDSFHSNIEDADMFAAIRALAGHISNVHAADSNRRLPGEGHIDFAGVTETLRQTGYEGYVALEVLNVPDREHIREHAAKSMELFKKGV